MGEVGGGLAGKLKTDRRTNHHRARETMKPPVQMQLLTVLGKIDRPEAFQANGRLPSAVPGLEVAGVGTIALPLDERRAEDLKKAARQAPYGKGTRTLVNTSVRRVWEIDADRVALANPEWAGVVRQAVESTQTLLGLEHEKLEAHLYKLLLYETGSFFLAHRDGEKLERMVATLVIALPSKHEGGELVIRHEGREEVVDFSPQSAFEIRYAAFYADCEHEVRPVTSGFRLSLVYNLTLEASNRSIAAPTLGEHIAEAARLLGQWGRHSRAATAANDDSFPSKLAILLEHQYSRAGLVRDALKGTDRARAGVLFAAAREAGCDASLALVTYWESGSAEDPDDYGYRRGRRRGHRPDDEGGRYIMEEVFDQSLTAEHFSDADGNPLAYGRIPVDEEEIVSEKPLNKGKPDQEDFEGFTGNAGMTLERWYHRAAVIVWPSGSRFDVLCEAGTEAAVGGLESMVRRGRRAKPGEREGLTSACLEFAGRIMENWPERKYARSRPGVITHYVADGGNDFEDDRDEEGPNEDDFDGESPGATVGEVGRLLGARGTGVAPSTLLLKLLGELDDVSLIVAWICKVLSRDATADPRKTLGGLCARHGWLAFQNELEKLFDSASNETLEREARLLADFALRDDRNADREKLASSLAGRLVSALERWDPQPAKRDWEARSVDLAALLSSLAQALLALKEPQLLERLVAYVLDRPKAFDWTTVQVPVLFGLGPWLRRNDDRALPPLRRWIAAIIAELEPRVSNPPREPADWRRGSETDCKCADCAELGRFLGDPNTEKLRLPLAEKRRQHLHNVIDRKKLDTTHVTERTGRPYTLVCTKTRASYERALKAHGVDLDQLAGLRVLLDWLDGLNVRPKRSPKAVSRPKPGPEAKASKRK